MFGGESRIYPIQLLVNYWELQPSRVGPKLDELAQKGVTSVTSFVPWQVFESDISHALARFLQAASERRIKVSLILTPEVGVHAAYSGLPRDVISKREACARHVDGAEVPVTLPPNAFPLPSLLSHDYTKRYYGFLAKLQSFFHDLVRSQEQSLRDVTLVQTGGFWKYYRSPRSSSVDPFGGLAGDYSKASAVSYRWCVDEFFADPEFTEPSPSAANRWKSAAMEEVNRRWFFQQSEEVFRVRSAQVLQKRPLQVEFVQMEVFTPEADPSLFYSSLLQGLSGGNADFYRLSSILDALVTREACVGGEAAIPSIHWSGLGGFQSLSESEKQFLLIKSLLLMGGRGGTVMLDHRDWFALTAGFRGRLETLARSLAQGRLRLERHVAYLTPHLWSSPGSLWDEIHRAAGPRAAQVASLDHLAKDAEARLAVVDAGCVLTRERLTRLLRWTHGGRVLALPRSALFSHGAREALEEITSVAGQPMEINLGVSYRLYAIGGGKLVLYELPQEGASSWKSFVAGLLSIANVESICQFSDGRLLGIPMSIGAAAGGGTLGLFVLNGTHRTVAADILFSSSVFVSDLAVAMAGEHPDQPAEGSTGDRFSLEVAPCGVIPLSIEGLSTDLTERHSAGLMSEMTRESAMKAAAGELTGFDPDAPLEGPTWN